MRNLASVILIGVLFVGLLFSPWSHSSFAASTEPFVPVGSTISDPIPGIVQGELAGGDPNWAIGAYATSTGLAVESTVWSNLPSSPNMDDVTAVRFMVNTPVAATGTVTFNSVSYNIIGVILQCVDFYSAPTTHYPREDVVFLATGGGSLHFFYYVPEWQNLNVGSGSVSQSLSYATHSSQTGWWCIMQGDYLGTLNTNGFFTPDYNPTNTVWSPGTFTWTLTSLGTTSTVLSYGNSYWNPSVAMEVRETTSGNLFNDNPNLEVEANVDSGAFYYYGLSTGTGGICSSTNHFLVGCDAAPGTAYGSGLTRTQSSGSQYYDEFGTSRGISSWMTSHWSVSSPAMTQTGGTNLPGLNVQYYLSMTKTGQGGYVTPQSGYRNEGEVVEITAHETCHSGISKGWLFMGWTGTGPGHYTGYDNPAYVTMNGAITESASFIYTYCPQFA